MRHDNTDIVVGMNAIAEKVRQEALGLPPNERASLAHELISSLDHANSLDLSPEYEQEIQRRLETVLAGQATSRPSADVFADIEAKLA
jgi:putative addiction module component (TIGR02574 family)